MASPLGMLIYPGAFKGFPKNVCGSSEPLCGLTALILALRAQDAYTQGHGQRVAAYAKRIAQRLQLAEAEIKTIRLGGLLHDIGKVAFSRKILKNRDSKLTEAMRAEIRQHPMIGGDFLRAIDVAEPVIDCVRFHHERLDGSGYPYKLKTSQIPLGAAIIGVADCFDALTTDRSYQKSRSLSQAVRILRDLSGTAFEAEVVKTLVEDVRENGMEAS
jgi:putative nucleotidyltransferase with HDIG domain